jgi:hypothetical protein
VIRIASGTDKKIHYCTGLGTPHDINSEKVPNTFYQSRQDDNPDTPIDFSKA